MNVELPMPANLLDILTAEKGIRDKTLVGIAANQECQEHLKLISEGIDVIQIKRADLKVGPYKFFVTKDRSV